MEHLFRPGKNAWILDAERVKISVRLVVIVIAYATGVLNFDLYFLTKPPRHYYTLNTTENRILEN